MRTDTELLDWMERERPVIDYDYNAGVNPPLGDCLVFTVKVGVRGFTIREALNAAMDKEQR